MFRPAALPGRKEKDRRIPPDDAFRYRHFEHLSKVPTQMVNRAERQRRLRIEEALQFVPRETSQLPFTKLRDNFPLNSVLIRHQR